MSEVKSDAKARYKLSIECPYLTPMLAVMQRIEDGKGTYSTEDGRYSVDYSEAEAHHAGMLMHECMHLFLRHWSRARADHQNDANLANIAGDLEINPSIKEVGLTLPEGVLYPSLYKLPDRLSEEVYYERLKDDNSEENSEDNSEENDGNSGENSEKFDGSNGDNSNENDRPIHGHCSCDITEEKTGDIDEEMVAKIEDARQKTATEILKPNSGAGTMLREMAKQIKGVGVINWNNIIKSSLRGAGISGSGHRKRSISKFNRRGSISKVITPGHRHIKERILIALDTSGSMDGILDDCMASIMDAIKHYTIDVFAVASEKSDVHKDVKTAKEILELSSLSGGTDMRLAFKEAEELNMPLILITDGYTPYPKVKPSITHLVVVINGGKTPMHINSININTKGGK